MLSKIFKTMRLLVLLLMVSYALTQRVSYENYKLYQVLPSTDRQLELLKTLEDNPNIDFWTSLYKTVHPISIMVGPTFQKEFENTLSHNNVDFRLLADDVERIIDDERTAQARAPRHRNGEVSFEKYLRYSEIQDYLQQLAIDYPDLIKLENYGLSYEKRNLTLIRISTGGNDTKPVIFADAGIHAREWVGPAQALYIINQLVEHPENRHFIQNLDWVVIPLLNPDGYEYTHLVDRFWRKTRSKGKECDGVDPNRNFGYHWMGPGSTSDECSNTYAGPSAFSEPETAALSEVIQSYSHRTKLYMTIHTPAQCLLYPWGYTSELPENAEELHSLGTKAAEAIFAVNGTDYAVGTSVEVLNPASGSSRDWAYGAAGIKLAYTVELPPYGDTIYELPPEKILEVVQEMFEGIKVFYEYVETKYGQL